MNPKGTFTSAQRDAIAALAKAFTRCEKAGVVFWGVDGELLAMPARVCPRDSVGRFKPLTEHYELFSEHGAVVASGSPYIDSGGW
jgi:hypothetical protein